MFIAVNVAIFGLGFAAALATAYKPNYTRSDIRRFLRHLRLLFDNLSDGSMKEVADNIPALILDSTSSSRRSSLDLENAQLLTKSDVETGYDMNTWQRLAYEDFKTTVLAKGTGMKTFPCVYATMGYRSNEHRYVFLESDDPSEPRNIRIIAPALKAYLDMSKSLGPNTSLVVVGAPSEERKSVMEYNNSFWEMLRGLRIKDPAPWPTDIPQDTASEKWTFCFNGEPLFPVSLTPAHQRRWSRHGSVPIIALQPKWVLDQLLSTPDRRKSATGKVRKLLTEYDQVEISPDLTSYGQPGTSEVHQLCLMDENEQATCPYRDFDR